MRTKRIECASCGLRLEYLEGGAPFDCPGCGWPCDGATEPFECGCKPLPNPPLPTTDLTGWAPITAGILAVLVGTVCGVRLMGSAHDFDILGILAACASSGLLLGSFSHPAVETMDEIVDVEPESDGGVPPA